MKEALYYRKTGDVIECLLCPNNCKIHEGFRGACGVRINSKGILYSEIYNRVTSVALDPIEKKPLYHYHKGEYILSLGTKGCNFKCPWCQNWNISQDVDSPTEALTALDAIKRAKDLNSFGIAYTYNEPFIWYEFVLECSKKARDLGLKNIFVTNGYINKEPLNEILPFIDAMNVDVKSIDGNFYKKYCGGELEPVLDNVISAKKKGVHIEITNLLIPTLNDSKSGIAKLVEWIAENLGQDTPLHFSRYFPCYKLALEPTPLETLKLAEKIAVKRLRYVHLGNI